MQQQLNASIRNTVTKPFSLQSFISDSPTGYRFEPSVSSALDLCDLTFEQTGIKGQLRYLGGLKVVSGPNNLKPILIPVKELPVVSKPSLPFQFQLSGAELIATLKASNPAWKGNGSFIFQKEGLGFQLAQFKGKSSKLEVDFDFVIYPDNSVGIQLKDTRLQGLSFPASLFKGTIQRKLQVQASAFRFKPAQILSQLPSSITLAKNGRVRFQKIYYDTSSLLIEGAFEGNWSLAK